MTKLPALTVHNYHIWRHPAIVNSPCTRGEHICSPLFLTTTCRGIIHRVPECLDLRHNWVPHHLPASECVSPIGPKGGDQHSLADEGAGTQFHNWIFGQTFKDDITVILFLTVSSIEVASVFLSIDLMLPVMSRTLVLTSQIVYAITGLLN